MYIYGYYFLLQKKGEEKWGDVFGKKFPLVPIRVDFISV